MNCTFNTNNVLDEKKKLIYLEKFYSFIIKNDKFDIDGENKDINTVLSDGHTDTASLRHQLRDITKTVLHRVCADVDRIIKSVPAEKAVDFHLRDIRTEYQTFHFQNGNPIWAANKFDNERREFHVQLAQAISALMRPRFKNPERLTNQQAKTALTREQRIEMGALMYIMQSIDNEYTFLSPTRSRLYNKCREILNIDSFADMDSKRMLDCITAFQNFLREENNLAALEKYGVEHFSDVGNKLLPLDRKTNKIERELNDMIVAIENNTLTCWNVARFLGSVTAMLVAPIGYGAGNVVGYFASETDYAVQPKLTVGHGLNDFAVAYVARTAGYLGFLTADRTVQYTLERAFGKLFEQMFMLAGFAAVGVGGYLVFKVSTEGYKFVSAKVRDAMGKIDDPEFADKVDVDFINCLCNLPPELFSEDKKLRLENITDPQFAADNAAALVSQGPELAPLLVAKENDMEEISRPGYSRT